jgi:hypothetical protein
MLSRHLDVEFPAVLCLPGRALRILLRPLRGAFRRLCAGLAFRSLSSRGDVGVEPVALAAQPCDLLLHGPQHARLLRQEALLGIELSLDQPSRLLCESCLLPAELDILGRHRDLAGVAHLRPTDALQLDLIEVLTARVEGRLAFLLGGGQLGVRLPLAALQGPVLIALLRGQAVLLGLGHGLAFTGLLEVAACAGQQPLNPLQALLECRPHGLGRGNRGRRPLLAGHRGDVDLDRFEPRSLFGRRLRPRERSGAWRGGGRMNTPACWTFPRPDSG